MSIFKEAFEKIAFDKIRKIKNAGTWATELARKRALKDPALKAKAQQYMRAGGDISKLDDVIARSNARKAGQKVLNQGQFKAEFKAQNRTQMAQGQKPKGVL